MKPVYSSLRDSELIYKYNGERIFEIDTFLFLLSCQQLEKTTFREKAFKGLGLIRKPKNGFFTIFFKTSLLIFYQCFIFS